MTLAPKGDIEAAQDSLRPGKSPLIKLGELDRARYRTGVGASPEAIAAEIAEIRREFDLEPKINTSSYNDPHNDGRDPWTKAVGNIETASGMRYDFENPRAESILLADIAHSLGNICRYGGQARRFNSVAEHSVLVSRIVEARGGGLYDQACALLHDGHEYVVWDAPSPLKPLLGDIFKELATKCDEVIARKFLTPLIPRGTMGSLWAHQPSAADFKKDIVKAADFTALVVEARGLLPVGPTDAEWEPLPEGVVWDGGLQPHEAKALFLARAEELGLC